MDANIAIFACRLLYSIKNRGKVFWDIKYFDYFRYNVYMVYSLISTACWSLGLIGPCFMITVHKIFTDQFVFRLPFSPVDLRIIDNCHVKTISRCYKSPGMVCNNNTQEKTNSHFGNNTNNRDTPTICRLLVAMG